MRWISSQPSCECTEELNPNTQKFGWYSYRHMKFTTKCPLGPRCLGNWWQVSEFSDATPKAWDAACEETTWFRSFFRRKIRHFLMAGKQTKTKGKLENSRAWCISIVGLILKGRSSNWTSCATGCSRSWLYCMSVRASSLLSLVCNGH